MRCVSSLHRQKVYWVYISLSVWMHVYRYSINASTPMNYIFTEFYTISRFYVTLYLLSYCVFRFSWCRAYIYIYICVYMCMYIYVCMYMYAYIFVCMCICIYMPANACYYVYMIICMSFMCAHFMYTDFMMFFTYGCLVRDDLIKKFKQTYVKVLWRKSMEGHSHQIRKAYTLEF